MNVTQARQAASVALAGPIDREDFFAAQRRHRRAALALSALAAVAVVLVSVPLAAIVFPLLFGIVALLSLLVSAATGRAGVLDPDSLARGLDLTVNRTAADGWPLARFSPIFLVAPTGFTSFVRTSEFRDWLGLVLTALALALTVLLVPLMLYLMIAVTLLALGVGMVWVLMVLLPVRCC